MRRKQKAVALRYDESAPAPFLSAKGKGAIAQKILEIADVHNIPVLRDDSLLDSLFTLNIGECIEEDLYEVVAIILSYVYGIQDTV